MPSERKERAKETSREKKFLRLYTWLGHVHIGVSFLGSHFPEQGTLWQSHRSPDQTETMVIESIHRFTKRVSVASFQKNGKGGWAIHYRATLRIGRAITLSLFEIPSSSGQAENFLPS